MNNLELAIESLIDIRTNTSGIFDNLFNDLYEKENVLLFSGGYDSTLLANTILMKLKEHQEKTKDHKKLRLITVAIKGKFTNGYFDIEQSTKIFNILKKKYPDMVTHEIIEVNAMTSLSYSNFPLQRVNIYNGLLAIDSRPTNYFFGLINGDASISKLYELKNIVETNNKIASTNAILITPMININKEEILEALAKQDEELFITASACFSLTEKDHSCYKCKEVKKYLYNILHKEEIEKIDMNEIKNEIIKKFK